MSNLIQPSTYLRIPTTKQTITAVKPKDICYIEDLLTETAVYHLTGNEVRSFLTPLTASEVEEGISGLDAQWSEYNDNLMNEYFGDK